MYVYIAQSPFDAYSCLGSNPSRSTSYLPPNIMHRNRFDGKNQHEYLRGRAEGSPEDEAPKTLVVRPAAATPPDNILRDVQSKYVG